MRLPRVLPLLLVILTCATNALAQDDFSAVELTLAGGEVVGKTQGLGTASVVAKVRNNSARQLEGIRIAAYYSQSDSAPPPGADWRIHEFVFEPPLIAGGSSTLRFKDEGAAEFVLLEARRLKFTAAVSYGGAVAKLEYPLLTQEGATFIAVRDLLTLTGGSLSGSKDAAGQSYIDIVRRGKAIRLRPASAEASVNGAPHALTRPLMQVDGRAYIALDDAARLLGLTVTRNGELDLIDLAEPPAA